MTDCLKNSMELTQNSFMVKILHNLMILIDHQQTLPGTLTKIMYQRLMKLLTETRSEIFKINQAFLVMKRSLTQNQRRHKNQEFAQLHLIAMQQVKP